MTAYVLVIVLAAGHHQPIAVGYPDQGSCLVAAKCPFAVLDWAGDGRDRRCPSAPMSMRW